MAYFNHAFRKMFLATGETQVDTPVVGLDGNPVVANTTGALLTTSGLSSITLNQLSQIQKAANAPLTSGYIGIFDPATHVSLNAADISGTCCPIYIAGSAIQANDKIGPFHGGYTETNKSKTINPRYVSRMYTQEACPATPDVLHIGATPYTVGGGILTTDTLVGGTGYPNGVSTTTTTGGTGTGAVVEITVAGGIVTGVTIISSGSGYTATPPDTLTIVGGDGNATFNVLTVNAAAGDGSCCATFLCDETYSLRLDIKGSPALRFLNRNTYLTVDAYTGCCADADVAPTAVDSTLVFIEWAKQIVDSPLISPFVQLVVVAEDGTLLYNPAVPTGWLPAGAITWDNYVSAGHVDGACAGMILQGAYVDTKFGDCTFQSTDFFEKEPVMLYASLMDMNGDPCEFEGLCVIKECTAKQAEGFGEQVIRDLILSESYRQNFFHSDLRIREITQGNQILTDVNRDAQYDRLYLLHSVPRFNNPSSTFDNDQYLLEFVALDGVNGLGALTTTLGTWLEGCGVCDIEAFVCSAPCELITEVPVGPQA